MPGTNNALARSGALPWEPSSTTTLILARFLRPGCIFIALISSYSLSFVRPVSGAPGCLRVTALNEWASPTALVTRDRARGVARLQASDYTLGDTRANQAIDAESVAISRSEGGEE